jgi:hypothetical protein
MVLQRSTRGAQYFEADRFEPEKRSYYNLKRVIIRRPVDRVTPVADINPKAAFG